MAQSVNFWDGVTYFDSSIDICYGLLAGGPFVIAEYLNSLDVTTTSPTNGSVQVGTGSALATHGVLYTNDSAVTVSITSATNNRLDRIVLRESVANQTVRVTKIIGSEGAVPALPALTEYDMPLAYVFVPAGYNPATTPIAAENIYDERIAKHVGASSYKYTGKDIMPNGEFLAYSKGNLTTSFPEGWRNAAGGAVSCTSSSLLGTQVRGRSVYFEAGVGEGLATTVPIPRLSTTETSYYTLRGMLNVTAGPARIVVSGRTLGSSATALITKDYPKILANETIYTLRIPITAAEAYDALDISITSRNAAGTIYVGQMMLVDGWIPGNFAPKHEFIWFDQDCTDASWTGTAKSSGDTTITYAGTFNANLLPYCRGLVLRTRIRDSGSASIGNMYLRCLHYNATEGYSGVWVPGQLADSYRESLAFVGMPTNDATNAFKVTVAASGVDTADCTLQPIGLLT